MDAIVTDGGIKKMQDENKPWLDSLNNVECSQPVKFLGQHALGKGKGFVIRSWQPSATKVELVEFDSEKTIAEMQNLSKSGVYAAEVDAAEPIAYKLRVFHGKQSHICIDPYVFKQESVAGDITHLDQARLYQYFGAHRVNAQLANVSVNGVRFAIWAPWARSVSLVGDFNGWDGRSLPMNKDDNGVWQLFLPNLQDGAKYKFEIKNHDGHLLPLKSDPYAFFNEPAPGNASIVVTEESYSWQDEGWLHTQRETNPLDKPLSIYELHFGSWKRHEDGSYLSYREMAEQLIPYVQELGYTHIELLPIMEYPFDGSWGYQCTGMFAPTSRYGSPDDLKYFIDCCHKAGLGIILDWVPAHFPKDGHGLGYFDGSALYHEMDSRRGEHPDWGTLIYDYNREHVRQFLISSAMYWLEEFHIDGLRVDAVASMLYLDYSREAGEWVPNEYGGNENLGAVEFLRQLNLTVYREKPGVMMIAEESTAWPMVSRPTDMGGLGFGLKWNMGWMHDTLTYMRKDPIHRQFHHGQLSFGLVYAFNENFILPLSHDEVVHGKGSMLDQMSGDSWQKFANLRTYYGFMYGHPGKKLLFMGSEFAQGREWNHNQGLDWFLLDRYQHSGIKNLVKDLNRIYKTEAALYEQDFTPDGFEWIEFMDAQASVIAFVRKAKDPKDFLVVICNFTPVVRDVYRLGVPEAQGYQELVNTDSEHYGGTNVGNSGYLQVEHIESHGRAQSVSLKIPPLATLILKPC